MSSPPGRLCWSSVLVLFVPALLPVQACNRQEPTSPTSGEATAPPGPATVAPVLGEGNAAGAARPEPPSLAPEQETRCCELSRSVAKSRRCAKKLRLYMSGRDACGAHVLACGAFNSSIFEIGYCFERARKKKKAAEVYRIGLSLPDWETLGGFSAHKQLEELLEALRPTKSRSVSYDEFERRVRLFAVTGNTKPLMRIAARPFRTGYLEGEGGLSSLAFVEASLRDEAGNVTDPNPVAERGNCMPPGRCVSIGYKGGFYTKLAFCADVTTGGYQWDGFFRGVGEPGDATDDCFPPSE